MKQKTWRLTIEYDGTRYSGWQEQVNARTVLGELRKAAREILRTPVEMQGAGRTDSGVHALGQVAHLKASPRGAPRPEQLLSELNHRLPADIAVLAAAEAPASFHARHDACARTYVYRIAQRKSAFEKKFVWWVKQPLDLSAMRQAAALVAGRHDFSCFCAPDPTRPDASPLVVVNSSELTAAGHLLVYRIEASHFLWRMVRRLTGALVRTGLGELPPAAWPRLLEGDAQGCDIAAWTAPSSGLFLESVLYRGPRPNTGARRAPATR